ncbi:transcriptional regulator, LacI family [Pelagirhabdus alkalitolerans]|uniref:Transcriptional regulator, LacI family n=1 Tax=Pelagirhabdus alkalitolerans TaxID=1612202 RepID=A0A1G6KBB3_9BACI|nr:LacI family DNA-binding transcriptional regulator [Pelagirhabdus alkalitolerans]SDC28158.1 transcriptional regulator, LacI family [Pelagirhabdus alkalitolerans]
MKIKDIAKLAGVSPATVSRVMNNKGYVKAEKRKAVERVIRDVNYQPNEIAKSLKNQKSKMIGVIVPKISTETASRVVDGITTVAKEHGYQLIIANTNLDVEEEIRYLNFLSNKLVDGIIMMATEITPIHEEVMSQLTIPIVIVGQKLEGYTSVLHDDYRASKAMVNYLIDKGHTDIAFIGVDPKDEAVGVIRKKAYTDALEEAGISVSNQQFAIGDFEIETAYKSMGELLTRSQPTAVFAVTDHLAIGAIHSISDHGLRIPDDISVVGIGDVKLAKYFSPPLTTVHYMFKTSGIKAAEALFENIQTGVRKNQDIMIDFQFEERSSVCSIIK